LEKVLAFAALLALACLVGGLLGIYRVSDAKLAYGAPVVGALYMGIQLYYGQVAAGRSWTAVVATRDGTPRTYWTILGLESALLLFVTYKIVMRTPLPH
jgi:hypothetical protein